MRRSLWILLAVVVAVVPALCVLAMRSVPARVLARDEHIRILPSTGQWYHDYSLRLGVRQADSFGVDSFTVPVGRDLFDAARVGARLTANHIAFLPRRLWIADSASFAQTIANIAEPHLKYYHNPSPVSPLQTQMAGLARVISVHSVQRRKFFWQKQESEVDASSQWMHLVEVEFWAQRKRTLVRTIDVIDAGSIPGLHPGDIVQMHFDPQNPRVLRLDDGRRTFARTR